VRKSLQRVRSWRARRKQRTVERAAKPRRDDSALLGVLSEQPALPLVEEMLLVGRERTRRLDRRRSGSRHDDA
jgi:hypothetical protein